MAAPAGSLKQKFRIWLLPLLIPLGAWLLLFFAAFAMDSGGQLSFLRLLEHPNPVSAANTLSNAAEVVAAAITVAAIIVELAANRYTHRITELFMTEPVNFVVMGFFVVAALQSVVILLIFDTEGGFVPYWGIGAALVMLIFSLLLLLPYFAFVFHFLNPVQIVDRIRSHTLKEIRKRRPDIASRHAEAVRGVEELADVALNAMEHKDKGVSMASLDAMQALVLEYQVVRTELPEAWFRVEGELAHNPDFVSMSPDVLGAVTRRRVWFEMKVLRQYQTLYNEALNRTRDICYVVAINTRHIAEAALEAGHEELLEVALKFFNTYLRATINAKDVRTAYNVLNQYRLLAERCLDHEDGRRAVEIARYFKYYGLVSFNAKLPFILETVAYDLCTLGEVAFDRKAPVAEELLRIFLTVDKESENDVQETSLRGVRKAQVKLATHYLRRGAENLARQVYDDMACESRERLASIRDELMAVRSSEFWEISDRGVNFDFLDPERKGRMLEFFSWFTDLRPPSAVSPEVQAALPASIRPCEPDELVTGPGTGQDPATVADT
ncbi:MAG: DUF2254 domain-containing protein [Deltaproteobacteria bacterium]|nr:DUF2254 domain-containing protein [Deltaproteobacteria bacterium]